MIQIHAIVWFRFIQQYYSDSYNSMIQIHPALKLILTHNLAVMHWNWFSVSLIKKPNFFRRSAVLLRPSKAVIFNYSLAAKAKVTLRQTFCLGKSITYSDFFRRLIIICQAWALKLKISPFQFLVTVKFSFLVTSSLFLGISEVLPATFYLLPVISLY